MLRSLAGFSSFAERLPRGASAQSPLHVGTDNRQAIHVTGIDPSKPWRESANGPPPKLLLLTLFSHAFEVTALIAILCIHFVRIDWPSNIVFLYHYPVEIDKGFGDHVEPFVRDSLGLLLESVPQETTPS